MRHWVVFYIEDYNLLFIDSFGVNPKSYDWYINDFYALYPGCKSMLINKLIRNEFSYVCGAYYVVISYLLSKNYTIKRIKSLFKKIHEKFMLMLL